MLLIYNTLIRLYYFAISVAAFFNKKANQWLNGRKTVFNDLERSIKRGERYIWVHCASLGEFEQGRPVIEALRKESEETKILLTFFSPSGYELRKHYDQADIVCYLPIDTHSNACRFLDIVRPVKVYFVKYEFWFHYLSNCKHRTIPVYIFSAIFRKEQLFFKWYGGWYRKILGYFKHIFVQDALSMQLLAEININNVSIAGDTRFDRVASLVTKVKDLPEIAVFSKGIPIIVCGSTWEPDEKLLIQYINETSHKLKFIIVPHEINEAGLLYIENKLKKSFIRYSQIKNNLDLDSNVLLIDNVGMLSSIYRYATIAYIGGGFGKGIHNTLEAATYGIPILFGPRYEKFKEAIDLIERGAAFSVKNDEMLKQNFDNLLNKNEFCENAGRMAAEYVKMNLGASNQIIIKTSLKC